MRGACHRVRPREAGVHAGQAIRAILVVASGILMLVLASVATLGEVYAFILVGDGGWDLLGFNPERDAFYSAASKMDNAFKSGWNIDPPNIAFVQAWEHSVADVFRKVGSMTAEVGEHDVFVFYYVGHGDGGSGAMMPWGKGAAGLYYNDLESQYLQAIKGEKVLILDACYAGTASDCVGADSWLVTSCGDEPREGSVVESPFSAALATAINNGATGVREAFENAEHVRDWNYGFLSEATSTPHLYWPAGVGSDEDLDIVEATSAVGDIVGEWRGSYRCEEGEFFTWWDLRGDWRNNPPDPTIWEPQVILLTVEEATSGRASGSLSFLRSDGQPYLSASWGGSFDGAALVIGCDFVDVWDSCIRTEYHIEAVLELEGSEELRGSYKEFWTSLGLQAGCGSTRWEGEGILVVTKHE